MSHRRRQNHRAHLEDLEQSTVATISVRQLQEEMTALLIPVSPTGRWDAQTVFGLQTLMFAIRADADISPSEDNRFVSVSPASVLMEIQRLAALARTLLTGMPRAQPGTWGANVLSYVQQRNLAVPMANAMHIYATQGALTGEAKRHYTAWADEIDAWGAMIVEYMVANEQWRNAVSAEAARIDLSLDQVTETLMEPIPRPSLEAVEGETLGSFGHPLGVVIAVGVGVVLVAGTVAAGIYAWNQPAVEEAKARQTEAQGELEVIRGINEGIQRGLTPDQIRQIFDPAIRFRGKRPETGDGFPWAWAIGIGAVAGVGWFLFSSSAEGVRQRLLPQPTG